MINRELNYFSLWTANLGVVPCFSLWFLRFLPAFLSFKRLLHLVCIVREAIIFSLFNSSILSKNRRLLLTFGACIVKAFLLSASLCEAKPVINEEIFLSKGEQTEISIKNLENYSIGNKEVLKHKYLKSKDLLILKAASLGFSDLIINTKDNKYAYKIYVTSKRSQLKKMEAAGAIEKSGLEVNTFSDVIYVSGEIKDLRTYLLYQKILKDDSLQVVSEVGLKSKFASDFIDKLYNDFRKAGFEFISCQLVGIDFFCQYLGDSGQQSLIKKYQQQFFVKISPLESTMSLKLKLYIVYIKQNDSIQRDSGLNQIYASLKDAIELNKRSLRTGDILLQDEGLESYLIASPALSILGGENFEVSIGEEQPIINQTATSQTTTFKFSGIKFKGKLESLGNHYKLKYQTEITESGQSNFSGPRGKSAFLIDLDQTKEILEFELDQKSFTKQSVPWLSALPYLGELLQKNETQFGQSILKFFITVEEDK